MTPAITSNFWRGKKVFISGHTGFKGSWLVFWLHQLGAKVTGFALAPADRPSLFEALKIQELCNHRLGDIRDLVALTDELQQARPEIIFHLAAQSLVLPSLADPIATYQTNVMGTAHLLEVCRKLSSLRSCIVVTTDKCYRNDGTALAFKESDPLGGHDPYSSSKACAELVATAFRESYFESADNVAAICSARAGNVFGGGDWSPYRLIPDAVKNFVRGDRLAIRKPEAMRPWQFVIEPLAGYLMLAEKSFAHPALSQAWNFGPPLSHCITVAELIEKFVRSWGEGASWEKVPDQRAEHESQILRLDCTKAQEQLGWNGLLSLEEGLQMTADWYRSFYNNATTQQLRDKCWAAIERYSKIPRL